MARIELKRMLPFTTWDAKRQNGRCDDNVFAVLEIETAKSKAGLTPFRCNYSWLRREYEFASVDDALAHLNDEVRSFAKHSGWTPEGE